MGTFTNYRIIESIGWETIWNYKKIRYWSQESEKRNKIVELEERSCQCDDKKEVLNGGENLLKTGQNRGRFWILENVFKATSI